MEETLLFSRSVHFALHCLNGKCTNGIVCMSDS